MCKYKKVLILIKDWSTHNINCSLKQVLSCISLTMRLANKSSDIVSEQKLGCDVFMYEITEAFSDENHMVAHNEPQPTNCQVKALQAQHNQVCWIPDGFQAKLMEDIQVARNVECKRRTVETDLFFLYVTLVRYPNLSWFLHWHWDNHMTTVFCPHRSWIFNCYHDSLSIWVRSRRCGCLVTWFCYDSKTR